MSFGGRQPALDGGGLYPGGSGSVGIDDIDLVGN